MTELERLALAAFVDPLTGLRNRRGLDHDLAQRIALAKRGGRPLTVVVGDLDGLKQINDRDGHGAGDGALRAFAAALDSALRAGDTAYRIGGDEFLLLLADTDSREAESVISRVKATAPAFSWGGATFPSDGEEGPGLIEVADHRLLSGRRQLRQRRAVQRTQVRRTGPRRGRSGALALVSLTLTALLGGAGVGFATQNVMNARENATTSSPGSPAIPADADAPRGATDPADSEGESVRPAIAGGADAPIHAPTAVDQGTALTSKSSPDELIGLAPVDATLVIEAVEETLGQTTSDVPAEEPRKGTRPGGGKSNHGAKPAR